MDAKESNLGSGSIFYMYSPSKNYKDIFFYPLCLGNFYYEKGYHLIRKNFDSYLIILVKSGKMKIRINNKTLIASSGDCILLDTYLKHDYECIEASNCLWLHFDGPQAKKQVELLHENFNIVIKPRNFETIEHTIMKMLHIFEKSKKIEIASFSKYITNILTELFLSGNSIKGKQRDKNIDDTILYIHQNYDQEITLASLAKMANLSPYYFSRVFYSSTNKTPHQYIIYAKVNAAKFLLTTTRKSIKEISYACGFSNESSFCKTFKKVESTTPGKYRIMNDMK
ncbi:MAG: AraC family transcriptional regulator [Anaerorhabdus sp.]